MALDALAVICQCGFLASTLFTFHGYTCHDERLTMHCPRDSLINVRWAQYGRVRSSTYQCQHIGMEMELQDEASLDQPVRRMRRMMMMTMMMKRRKRRRRRKRSRTKELNTGEDCLASSSLKVVMDLCQSKNSCRVRASHRVFKETPCPFSQLEVGYQCLPMFPSKAVSCTGSEMILQCPPALRLLILNATYGYKFPGEPKCAAQIGFDADCVALCSTYVVTSRCHGQKTCKIFVDGQTFGDPCRPGTIPYLSVFYACVPMRTLSRSLKRKDFPYHQCDSQATDSGYDNGYYKPTYLTTPLPTRNVEKFILYILIGASIGLVSLLLVIIAKLFFDAKLRRTASVMQRLRPSRGDAVDQGRKTRRAPFGSRGHDEFEVELGRDPGLRPSPAPATISAEELPSRLSAPDDGSPVFIHVESPRESPVLARNNNNNDSNDNHHHQYWEQRHESNGEEFPEERFSFLHRASSLPRQSMRAEHSLLLPIERERALNGKSALSEGRLGSCQGMVSNADESPRAVHLHSSPLRSTSNLPRASRQSKPTDVEGGAASQLVHSFSNPYRNDESLVLRRSSLRRKSPATLLQ